MITPFCYTNITEILQKYNFLIKVLKIFKNHVKLK